MNFMSGGTGGRALANNPGLAQQLAQLLAMVRDQTRVVREHSRGDRASRCRRAKCVQVECEDVLVVRRVLSPDFV